MHMYIMDTLFHHQNTLLRGENKTFKRGSMIDVDADASMITVPSVQSECHQLYIAYVGNDT